MYPSVAIGSYGYYLLALYTAALFNPATYLTQPVANRGKNHRDKT